VPGGNGAGVRFQGMLSSPRIFQCHPFEVQEESKEI
jgi:hypothetical protein